MFLYFQCLLGNQFLNILKNGLEDLFNVDAVYHQYPSQAKLVTDHIPSKLEEPVFDWNGRVILHARQRNEVVDIRKVLVELTCKVGLHSFLPVD